MSDTPKASTLWPMPGGATNYLPSMRLILSIVDETTDTSVVIDRMMDTFQLRSRKSALSYLRVLHTLGFVEILGSRVLLTAEGKAERLAPSADRVRSALLTRVAGCDDILSILASRPMRISALAQRLRGEFGWTRDSQVRYRLRWLEGVGAVSRSTGGRPAYELRTDGVLPG